MDNLKFTIPGKPEYLTMVRLAISSIAGTVGFSLDQIDDIKDSVEEACKNVSCHGFDGYSDRYELQCNIDDSQIEIIVKDDCDKHTLEKLSKPCQNCPDEGNLGMFIIKSLVDEVEVGKSESGHKYIKMVKKV